MNAREQNRERQLRKVADRLAAHLFTNAMNERADTLRLTMKDGRYLGGWCELAMADQIYDFLMKAYLVPTPMTPIALRKKRPKKGKS